MAAIGVEFTKICRKWMMGGFYHTGMVNARVRVRPLVMNRRDARPSIFHQPSLNRGHELLLRY